MALDRRQILGWGSVLLSSILAFAAWAVVVLMSARPEFRKIIDTTPGQSVSLRPGTEALLAGLRDRDGVGIEIYTFFEPLPSNGETPQIRAAIAISRRVQNLAVSLLRQYGAAGGDKCTVRHVDPRREPDKAKEISERLGGFKDRHVVIVAVVREKEGSGESIQKKVIPLRDFALIDMGSGAPAPGGQRPMPRLEDFTGEEQLSSAIKTLLAGGTPTVYLLKGHGEELATKSNSPYDYTNLVAGLQDSGFKVTDLNLKESKIPPKATVIACLEPEQGFLDSECEAIHAWLKRGGRLFLNVSYHDVDSRNPTLENLLAPLGVTIGRERVSQIWSGAPAAKARLLEITPKNTALPITRGLVRASRTIQLQFARPIFPVREPVDGSSVDQSLLRTDPNCWLAGRASPGVTSDIPPRDPRDYESRCVGAVVTISAEDGDHAGRVILIGGTGFNNQFIESGSQKEFVMNCFNWLAERKEHVDVGRDRVQLPTRNIKSITNPDEVAALMSRARWLLLGVPAGFFLLGLVVWWARRRL